MDPIDDIPPRPGAWVHQQPCPADDELTRADLIRGLKFVLDRMSPEPVDPTLVRGEGYQHMDIIADLLKSKQHASVSRRYLAAMLRELET